MEQQNVLANLSVEQYKSLRQEILQRVQARQGIWSILLLIAGTLLGVGVQPAFSAWSAFIYPILALPLASNWAHNEVRINQLAWYIEHKIERPFNWEGWETYCARDLRNIEGIEHLPISSAPNLFVFSIRGVFLTTQLLAVAILLIRLGQNQILLAIIAGTFDLVVTFATYLLLRERRRHLHTERGKISQKS